MVETRKLFQIMQSVLSYLLTLVPDLGWMYLFKALLQVNFNKANFIKNEHFTIKNYTITLRNSIEIELSSSAVIGR